MSQPTLEQIDPWLKPYAPALEARRQRFRDRLTELEERGGLLGEISQGHHYFGLNRGERNGEPGVWYREWAPGAQALALIGDFNGWNRHAHPLTRDEYGVWSTFLPDKEYASRLTHGSRVKVRVTAANGEMDRIPAYIRRVVQENGTDFVGQYWCPPHPYQFQHPPPRPQGGLRIYESHVGMAQEAERVGTFAEFAENVLPRARAGGYDAVQFMAVQEHPYYGSFGYHVSSFFAVSSRFGTPDEFKALVDAAHGMGLLVLMDLVHSHAVKNVLEGLNLLDGTEFQYFHAGERGEHPQWDSRLFDYGKDEVQRFLLSNLRYWLEEYRLDGFRFDGITSVLYRDHALGTEFTSYEPYFGPNMDEDAVSYLQLANELAHAVHPGAITIAEEHSGMPGLARPAAEGGLGFNYRLAMGIPDFWIKLVKEKRDEEWSLGEIWHTLLDRRSGERHVAYVESHDQALVGDQTLAFRLMGAEMYTHMSRLTPSLGVDRGVALHKLIRLLTFTLGGEGYLCFMGNEFGHPEWVDFPREGNGYSYQYARRQWSLADNADLRYHGVQEFDRALLALDPRFNLLHDPLIEQLAVDEEAKTLVYRHGPLVFAVNLHPEASYADLRIPVPDSTDYAVILDTDAAPFEGQGRVAAGARYPYQKVPLYGRAGSVQIYLPARTAQVLAPVKLA